VTTHETQPPKRKPVAVIGAGLDLGQGRRGVDMGPSAIRYAELNAHLRTLGLDVDDWGDVGSPVPETTEEGATDARYAGPIMRVCEQIAAKVRDATERGHTPLVLGGDHSIAMGTLGGMAGARGPGAALWIDAHGDLNRPETSPSGNVHGMPLAAALGAGGPAFDSDKYPVPSITRAALVGVRSLDQGERELIRELDVRVFTMSEIDKVGVERVLREALAYLVEVNPILDRENETGKLAVELVASALGARIL